jgi:hypothetical protein
MAGETLVAAPLDGQAQGLSVRHPAVKLQQRPAGAFKMLLQSRQGLSRVSLPDGVVHARLRPELVDVLAVAPRVPRRHLHLGPA